jgi:hypothetical protein
LAVLLVNGKELPRDISAAHYLASTSKKYGYQEAEDLIKFIEENVSSDQIQALKNNTGKMLKNQ